MKTIKMGLLPSFVLLLFSALRLHASFVLDYDRVLVEKSVDAMNAIATELKEKTDVSLYVALVQDLNGRTLQEYEHFVVKSFSEPYIAMIVAIRDQKINIIESQTLKDVYDKKRTYWDYIVPMLPKKNHEKTPQRYSALILNGHADIVDQLSKHYGVTLSLALPDDYRTFNMYVRYTFVFMIATFFGALVYRRIRSKD
jgi:hypothetical protein